MQRSTRFKFGVVLTALIWLISTTLSFASLPQLEAFQVLKKFSQCQGQKALSVCAGPFLDNDLPHPLKLDLISFLRVHRELSFMPTCPLKFVNFYELFESKETLIQCFNDQNETTDHLYIALFNIKEGVPKLRKIKKWID